MPDFTTERLTVEDWTPHLGNEMRRLPLEARLREMLTPEVTAHLPPPLHLPADGSISDWIAARTAEAQVCLVSLHSGRLVGLLILARFGGEPPDIHIGYLFAKEVWGQGLATEVLGGLKASLPRPARLLAGVARDNRASARVLEKTGFERIASDNGLYGLDLS